MTGLPTLSQVLDAILRETLSHQYADERDLGEVLPHWFNWGRGANHLTDAMCLCGDVLTAAEYCNKKGNFPYCWTTYILLDDVQMSDVPEILWQVSLDFQDDVYCWIWWFHRINNRNIDLVALVPSCTWANVTWAKDFWDTQTEGCPAKDAGKIFNDL